MRDFLLGTTDGLWRIAGEGQGVFRAGLAGYAVTHLLRDGRGEQYATDGRQVWRSLDGWQSVTTYHFPDGHHVTALAASPHAPYPLFAGTMPAALYRSDDGGATWRELAGFARCPGHEAWTFPGPSPLPRVNALAFDAVQAQLLFATVEVGGILRSRDGGETWANCSLAVNRDAHVVVAHPVRGGLVYASTGFGSRQPAGVYRSADGGESWEYRFAGLAPAYTRTLLVDECAHDLVYVTATPQQPPYWALPEGPRAVLWRGQRGGERWAIVFPDAAVAAGSPERLISALALDPAASGSIVLAHSEVLAVLHAQGALGRPPGGPFPAPERPAAAAHGDATAPATAQGEGSGGARATAQAEDGAGAPEIAQARRRLQRQLVGLDAATARGRGDVWRLGATGEALRLHTDLPAILAMLPLQPLTCPESSVRSRPDDGAPGRPWAPARR